MPATNAQSTSQRLWFPRLELGIVSVIALLGLVPGGAASAQATRDDLAPVAERTARFRSATGAIIAEYDSPGAVQGVVAVGYDASTKAFFKFNNGRWWLRDTEGRYWKGELGQGQPIPWSEGSESRALTTCGEFFPQLWVLASLDHPEAVESVRSTAPDLLHMRVLFRSTDGASGGGPVQLSEAGHTGAFFRDLWIAQDGTVQQWQDDGFKQPVAVRYSPESPAGFSVAATTASGTFHLRKLSTASSDQARPWFTPRSLLEMLASLPGPRPGPAATRAATAGLDVRHSGANTNGRSLSPLALVITGCTVVVLGVIVWWRRRSS